MPKPLEGRHFLMPGSAAAVTAHTIQEGDRVNDKDTTADLLDDASNPEAHTLPRAGASCSVLLAPSCFEHDQVRASNNQAFHHDGGLALIAGDKLTVTC